MNVFRTHRRLLHFGTFDPGVGFLDSDGHDPGPTLLDVPSECWWAPAVTGGRHRNPGVCRRLDIRPSDLRHSSLRNQERT